MQKQWQNNGGVRLNCKLRKMEIKIDDLETAIKDFEIGDKLTEVILLSESGKIRRVILE